MDLYVVLLLVLLYHDMLYCLRRAVELLGHSLFAPSTMISAGHRLGGSSVTWSRESTQITARNVSEHIHVLSVHVGVE